MTKEEATLRYLEEYRSRRRQLDLLRNEMISLKGVLDEKRSQAANLDSEIASMRRIITAMIDQDADPVEIKMKNDLGSLLSSLWDAGDASDFVILSSMHSGVGAMGIATGSLQYPPSVATVSIGATGNTGPTGLTGMSASTSANGGIKYSQTI